MANVKEKTTEIVTVKGSGSQKKQAFASALNTIHNQILKSANDVIVRIEPIDIEIITAEAVNNTERFLFFFMPRKRVDYHVELKVTIELTKIIVDKVPFVNKQKKTYERLSLPKRKRKKLEV